MEPVDLRPHDSAIRYIGVSPTNDAIFTADSGQHINIYELSDGVPRFAQEIPMGPVQAVAIHFEHTLLACATLDNRIFVWDWSRNSHPYETHPPAAPVSQIVFHPNGNQLLSATTDGRIDAWPIEMQLDTVVSNERWSEQAPQEANILTYTPNGAIIMASWGDETIRLWDSTTFQLLGSIESRSGPIRDIDFSPDGKLMAMATERAIEFWEVSIPAQITSIP